MTYLDHLLDNWITFSPETLLTLLILIEEAMSFLSNIGWQIKMHKLTPTSNYLNKKMDKYLPVQVLNKYNSSPWRALVSHLNLHYSSAVMSGLWFTLRGSLQCLWLVYMATEEAAIKRVSNDPTPPFSEKPQMSCVIGLCSWVQGLDGILTLSLGEIKGARGMHTNQVLSQQGNVCT